MIRQSDFEALMERMGRAHFRQRLHIQVEHASEALGIGRTPFHIENADWLIDILRVCLHVTGLSAPGYRGYRDIRVRHNVLRIPSLPRAFAGYRILHLSDLHIDLDDTFAPVVIEGLKNLRYDLCVFTGDYRAATHGDYGRAVAGMISLLPHLSSMPLAVLGNHDFLEMVPPLERAGYRVLLNETLAIERAGATLHVAGIDDPHFYQTDNLQKVRDAIPSDGTSILLSHSPEIYVAAAACGFDLMLCGHTHGGQICLPGQIAVMSNGRCPRKLIHGAWSYRQMQGYTSAGVGACGVPARFHCPGEIALHELRPAEL